MTGPGQADLCEAGNEEYAAQANPGEFKIGPASSVAKNREITKREDGLDGEKYEPTQLNALGLAKPKPKPKPKTKTKSKGKKK